MTTATNTALGEIKLAGDLAGNNNGLAPELTTVLGTPGAFMAPTITVDAKGRITAIANTSGAALASMIPDASASVKGLVKIGSNINVSTSTTSGSQTINFGGTLTNGTSTALCNNGAAYSFNLLRDGIGPLVVTLTANSMSTVLDLINAVNAVISPFSMSLVAGNLKITSNTTGPSSTVSVTLDQLFQYVAGYVGIGPMVNGTGDGTIFVNDATSSVKGVAKFGTDFTVSGGSVSLNLRDATASVKGIVQVGSGLSATAGVISANPIPDATTSSKGLVEIGSGLAVTAGVLSTNIPDATTSSKGLVEIGSGLSVTAGVLSTTAVPDATTSSKGLVQVGSGFSVTDGTISVDAVADATYSTKGLVQVGSGLVVSAGVVSLDTLPDATTDTKGIVKIGSGLNVTDGVITTAALPDATYSTKGLVQVGSGLSVTAGSISATPIPDATTASKGLVQVGYGLSVTAGVVSASSIPDATTSIKGLVQVGSGINVAAGVISIDDATTSSKGVVQIDTSTGLSVTSGILSAAPASNTNLGVVNSADTTSITITAGAIDVGSNIPKKNSANTFTKAQVVALSTLASSASITPDFSNSNVFYLDATSNFTLNAPTNIIAGGTYIIIIKQDATGNRVCTYNAAYKFGLNAVSVLSTGANKVDIISMVAQSSSVLLATSQLGF